MSIKENLISIMGKENVSDDPVILNEYAGQRNFCFHTPPIAVTKINNSEQVQMLIKWANETKTPLIPVSSKAPHINGGSSPSVPGAIIADLSEMKKILSINRQHRMAVIEPGVTYGELSEALSKEGLVISGPLKPRAGKSVVSSILEVEPRLDPIHQWSYIDPLRSLEVIWGDGNRMFTGEAGLAPMDLEKQWSSEQWQVNGTGPWMFDFYRALTGAQGTMGIVTWAAVKCQVKPSIRKVYFATANDLDKLEDFIYTVIHYRFSDEIFILNKMQAALLIGKDAADVETLKEKLPEWMVLVSVCGRELLPEKRVEVRSKDIENIATKNGLKLSEELAGIEGSAVLEIMEKADGENCWKDKCGSSQGIFFITTIDRAHEFVKCAKSVASAVGFNADDVGVYVQPLHLGTSCHCEIVMPYRATDGEKAKRFYQQASKELAALNAYFSRPYGIWADIQLNKDARSYSVLSKLKSIFDPNGIMNPGKLTL